ncbi:esterase/lipase family protein [Chromobacterium phragmitis]|uniref:Alpha/beta hydrolase n=1 Tax=Chromobacterium phragmitis TaxID=2202141 RepID=A0A344ULC8_9NEIS|nr:hypothetical protein [Chromobacterium phragmitis]AXE36076.1 hypothetical protein DK843_18305 [Chromobacterium phragmitis]
MAIQQPINGKIGKNGVRHSEGSLSPNVADTQQNHYLAPDRVIPVIFIPGIMGSNLRMTAERQQRLKSSNNVAWSPDRKEDSLLQAADSPRTRQLRLDPEATVVDLYDPKSNPTGDPKETAAQRHSNAVPVPGSHLSQEEARQRGWGEIYFASYGELLRPANKTYILRSGAHGRSATYKRPPEVLLATLNRLEMQLNRMFANGKLQPEWKGIVGVDPKSWQAASSLPPLTEADLKQASKGCWFPVHAFGYNWLQSNADSARALAKRINDLMAEYKKHSRCEKVIIVTHSMGGLVGRALAHPAYGNLQDKILGVVHGVMPAIGAAAAYRRMLAGFESAGFSFSKLKEGAEDYVANLIVGNTGPEVMPVLGNAPGGLQLLPSIGYGANWLKITDERGSVLKQLPSADPYAEIYSRSDVWWGLLRQNWLNPARLPTAGADYTRQYLKDARKFHQSLAGFYHPCSYAHYGCDNNRKAFQNVVWKLKGNIKPEQVDSLAVTLEDGKGKIHFRGPGTDLSQARAAIPIQAFAYEATIQPPAEAGDQTVPMLSADDQSRSGKFKGIFRQTGYEHQASYKDARTVASTLYSIIQIAKQMKWESA